MDGCPMTSDVLPGFTTTRLAVIKKFWQGFEAYDVNGRYQMVVADPPVFNALQTFLAHLCYNPMEQLDGKWERIGDYDPARLIQTVRTQLETDDDIIQQWFESSDVIKLLESAKSFDEMMLAVKAICGEHETDKEVMAYVQSILGPKKKGA
jgi:hypothetical protein